LRKKRNHEQHQTNRQPMHIFRRLSCTELSPFSHFQGAVVSRIEVRNLTKAWGDYQAVAGIDFCVEAGEFAAILGPSGCGKSTTLRLLAGLEQPTSGEILIGGREVSTLEPAERQLSMVFQSYALFPHLTVRENIVFGLSVRKTPQAETKRRLDRATELLSLGKLLDRKPSQLSGGQQQRVALGRALVAETSVCLLDEPLSNLDAKLRQEMRLEIRALQKRLGMTMIYVTHDQTEAMSMADRIILMRDGRVEQNGKPADLYHRPESVFVGGFVGSPPMNVLDLVDTGVGAAIAGGSADIVMSRGLAEDLQLGLRPEDISLALTGYPAVVESAEYFGADTVITCRIGTQKVNVRTRLLPPGVGDAVHLSWPSPVAHFFRRSTGRRVSPPGDPIGFESRVVREDTGSYTGLFSPVRPFDRSPLNIYGDIHETGI
jgi:sn-glycerol 3-phosphate transport system ATP-binding protein